MNDRQLLALLGAILRAGPRHGDWLPTLQHALLHAYDAHTADAERAAIRETLTYAAD